MAWRSDDDGADAEDVQAAAHPADSDASMGSGSDSDADAAYQPGDDRQHWSKKGPGARRRHGALGSLMAAEVSWATQLAHSADAYVGTVLYIICGCLLRTCMPLGYFPMLDTSPSMQGAAVLWTWQPLNHNTCPVMTAG